jgi:glucose/arabinose dehydrogenase
MRAAVKYTSSLLIGAFCAAPSAFAAWSYKDCADLGPTDFSQEILLSNATDKDTEEPMKMAFDMDGQGNVSVYFTQRQGKLRKYDPIKKATVLIGEFNSTTYPGFTTSFSGNSDGLLGIALDPAFKTNKWVYLFLTAGADQRVSRFVLNGETLDMGSEKILLTIPKGANSVHPGGALQFDKSGNLWITTGDNGKGWPSANTNDLRGKLLRIRPTADGKYTLPEGNLFPAGDKTKGETYIMGNRNPYTISLDPVRNGVTWGDIGPDAGALTEERNFATKAGNHGWPMYAGNQVSQGKGGGTVDKPLNNDASNTGLTELPAAIPGFDNYKQSCSITGPVYYYDAAFNTPVRMPPHFSGVWFVSDFSRFAVEGLKLDASGSKILSREPIFKEFALDRILDFQVGPDGAFYFVNYAGYRDFTSKTGIIRFVYKGNCRPASIGDITVGTVRKPAWAARDIQMRGSLVSISSTGSHILKVKDVAGRELASHRGRGRAEYNLSGMRGAGILLLTLTTAQGEYSWKLVR